MKALNYIQTRDRDQAIIVLARTLIFICPSHLYWNSTSLLLTLHTLQVLIITIAFHNIELSLIGYGADSMIFQTEKQLTEFGEKLSDDKKEPIEAALTTLKAAHESKDLAQIDAAMETINEAWKAASEEMYAAQGGAEGANPGADQQGQPEANDAQGDNVEDVDFEEVK